MVFAGRSFVVRAVASSGALWRVVDARDDLKSVAPADIGLSDRLCAAFDDWAQFFDEIDGDLTDPEVAEEFVSQGFKIAHRLRAEIKGSTVHLVHPVSGESVEIVRTGPR